MNAYQAWAGISHDLNHEILETAYSGNKKLYRLLLEDMAKNLRRRVVALQMMPRKERHLLFRPLLAQPQLHVIAQNLLMFWLSERQTPMLCQFLGALGIAHDEKGCAETFPETVEPAKLTEAVQRLYTDFPEETVSLYLTTFDVLSGKSWPELPPLIRPLPSSANS